MSTPLRFVLRYDPVFLELGKRLARGEWGRPTGVSVSAVLAEAAAERDFIAFMLLLFGHPVSASRSDCSTFTRYLFLYENYALTAECVVAEEAPLYGRSAAVTGSLSCSSSFAEFRLGAERLLTVASGVSKAYRASMAEGDGERYRSMDERAFGGPVVVSVDADAAALAAADRLFAGSYR